MNSKSYDIMINTYFRKDESSPRRLTIIFHPIFEDV
jgi:hypothetical protein